MTFELQPNLKTNLVAGYLKKKTNLLTALCILLHGEVQIDSICTADGVGGRVVDELRLSILFVFFISFFHGDFEISPI